MSSEWGERGEYVRSEGRHTSWHHHRLSCVIRGMLWCPPWSHLLISNCVVYVE